MTMLLRLDSSALTALIEADPEFKIDLQRAVVAEVVKKVFLNDFTAVLTKVMPDMIQELTSAIQEDEATREEIKARLSDLVKSVRAGTHSYSMQKQLPGEVKTLISNEVSDLVRNEVARVKLRTDSIVKQATAHVEEQLTANLDKRIRGIVDHDVGVTIRKGVATRLAEVLALASADPTQP